MAPKPSWVTELEKVQAAKKAAASVSTNNTGTAVYNTPAPTPTASVPTSNHTTQVVVKSEVDKRREEVSKLVFSTTPEIAVIQKKAQDEYVTTGKWNPTYTQQADAIRSGLNPMYPGGGAGFNENQYILPGASNTPTLDNIGAVVGNVVGGGAQTIGAMTGSVTGMLAIGSFIVLLAVRGGR